MKYFLTWIFVSVMLYANKLEGVYETESFFSIKSAFVEFFKYNGVYYAYGIANVDGSPAGKDLENPNPALRNRSDKGVVFLYGLTQTAPDIYSNGRAYNFYDGRTYYVDIHQKANGDIIFHTSLDKYGFIGKSFLWKSINENYLKQEGITKPPFSEVLKTLPQFNP